MATKPHIIVKVTETGYITEVLSDEPVEVVVVEENHHLAELTAAEDFEEDNEYQLVPKIDEEREGPKSKELMAVGRIVPTRIDTARVIFVFNYIVDTLRMETYYDKCRKILGLDR